MDNYLDLGSAVLEGPMPIKAGSYGTWNITYEVGPLGLEQDAVIGLAWLFASDWGTPQCSNPQAPNFFSATTTGQARLELRFDRKGYKRPWWPLISVRVVDGALNPGDKVSITLGDRSHGSVGQRGPTALAPKGRLKFLVDYAGVGTLVPIQDMDLPVAANAPARATLIAPSSVTVGEHFSVLFRVEDEWGNPSSVNGRVLIRGLGPISSGEALVKKRLNDEALCQINGVHLPTAGLYRLHASANNELQAVSNPIRVTTGIGVNVLWGDLHSQSSEALGLRTATEHLTVAKEVAGLDFASLQGNDYDLGQSDWASVEAATKSANEDGRFVAFLGYEWSGNTPSGGDHNVIYLNEEGRLLRSGLWCVETDSGPAYTPISRLFEELNSEETLIMPHVGGRHADLRFHDVAFQPLIEIASTWGYFEWFLTEALERGMEVGFTAGTDDHKGRPGMRSYTDGIFSGAGGLTAVIGATPSKESLWKALKHRQCYATTGDRILLDVSICGQMMGSKLTWKGAVPIRCEFAGTAPIVRVDLYRGTQVIASYKPQNTDKDPKWLRVDWSGVRPRRRYARLEWDISINGDGVDFSNAECTATGDTFTPADSGLGWDLRSSTVGEERACWLPLRVPPKEVSLVCEHGPLTWRPGQGDAALAIRKNDVWADVRMSAWYERPGSTEMEVTWVDEPEAGCYPYWVKVVQDDGQMAISSPVYIEIK